MSTGAQATRSPTAVDADLNQYAITWGSKPLRDAIAATTPRHFPGWGDIDPETQVTVTCGATEAMIAAMLGILDPGDEVVIFEPFYENYGPDAILSGAVPRYVTLHEPDWSIDPDELRAAFGDRTRAIVVNSPHNPTGKVFSREELTLIAGAVPGVRRRRPDRRHLRAHRLRGRARPAGDAARDGRPDGQHPLDVQDVLGDGLADRLGHRLAGPVPRDPTGPRLPDGRCRGAAPGRGGRRRCSSPTATTASSSPSYRERRDAILPALRAAGFRVHDPAGAYYVMTDIGDLARDGEDDVAFALRLIAEPGHRGRARLVVLLATRAGPDQAPVRVPQAPRDPGGGGGRLADLA